MSRSTSSHLLESISLRQLEHLISHQLDNPRSAGLSFAELYGGARANFLATSEASLSKHLAEFITHDLVRKRSGAGGQQVYCGRGELIEQYFTSLGFRLPDRENPADWLIDVVCGLSPRYNDDGSVDENFKAPADLFSEEELRYMLAQSVDECAAALPER